MANPAHLALLFQGNAAIRQWFRNRNGERLDLREASLKGIDLSGEYKGAVNLTGSDFYKADLEGANLSNAYLAECSFYAANLRSANLASATLLQAQLSGADLTNANLTEAYLRSADLAGTNLSGANMRRADLMAARLLGTRLDGADLTGCYIWGISTWDVSTEGTVQRDLVLSRRDEAELFPAPDVTIDELEVAQFIYLLMENRKIRNIIQTVTSKSVLILGRFTKERKHVLEAIRAALRNDYDLVPILFDFEPSSNRDLTETIQLLASLSRFVIADVTEAKSIPQELSHIIPNMPSVPVQPIILASQREYGMFEHWQRFNSVLPAFSYEDEKQLVADFEKAVIKPVELWEAQTKKNVARERAFEERIKALEAENRILKAGKA